MGYRGGRRAATIAGATPLPSGPWLHRGRPGRVAASRRWSSCCSPASPTCRPSRSWSATWQVLSPSASPVAAPPAWRPRQRRRRSANRRRRHGQPATSWTSRAWRLAWVGGGSATGRAWRGERRAEWVVGGQAGVGISTRPSMAIWEVRRCRTGKAYAATVWLRASRPGTLMLVDVIEASSSGGRDAVDTAVPCLASAYSRCGDPRHPPVRRRARDRGGRRRAARGRHVFADDLALRVTRASSKP